MSGETQRFAYLFPERIDKGEGGKLAMHWPKGVDPFAAERALAENEAQATVQVLRGVFSPEECARICALGAAGERVSGALNKGEAYHRVSEVTWLEPGAPARWLYHRIGALFVEMNRIYGFALTGMVEPLQYARYAATAGGHLDWHMDLGVRGIAGRKLSMTVQLSDPASYDGGDLEFLSIHQKTPERSLGTVIVFPGYIAHRVSGVTRGERHSLVAWAYGPSFR